MVWKAVKYSATGVSHRRKGMPCQDYSDYRLLINNSDDAIIGVVADGAGSAKSSHVGAKIVVDTVISFFKRVNQPIEQKKSEPLDKQNTQELFKNVFNEVIAALRHESDHRGCALQDLACTMIAFLATADWLGAMQIGDGLLVVRPEKDDYQLLFKPDKGEFINETTFVTSKNAMEEMQVEVLQGKQAFICASTDGIEKVAIRLSDWTPFPPFFQPLEKYLETTENPQEDSQYLQEFLDSERLNARTSDDKTILLCQFNEATTVNSSQEEPATR